ncbi:hypothetical protein [Aurantibacillus circumpalustris]|uniref:hypothetical protein n=1 Tax=Aurantibacillus circumpalustris TaxID=3036359 RepID=UPI00295BC3BF|nr:hypothetical protein [Aurantibacillus circumpalustris]
MYPIKIALALLIICFLTSCQKTYTCECTNPGGVYASYTLKESKTEAEAICAQYNAEANSIPWSENNCALK